MTDISVIILIGQEKIHLKRCIERLALLEPKCIYLIESQPDDGGVAIAKETAAQFGLKITTKYNKWPRLYAKQFNWALDNCSIDTTWVLRLDADEYLYPDTCEEVKCLISSNSLPQDVSSLSLARRLIFCGREIRFGGTVRIPMVRFFKFGVGRCEERAMDEHIIIREGCDYRLKGEFVDHNLNTMNWWRKKHRGYAKREAMDALAFERGEIHFKSGKEAYYKMPRYLRALIYFGLRYFLCLGFLDGYAGWMWHFWQGLWYRCLVDKEIARLKKI